MLIYFKHIVLLIILSSQLWSNTLSYLYHIASDEVEFVELIESEEKESEEKEKENEKEEEIQVEIDLSFLLKFKLENQYNSLDNQGLKTSPVLKIEIPPPQAV